MAASYGLPPGRPLRRVGDLRYHWARHGAHAVLDIQQRCGVEQIFRSPGGDLGVGLGFALGKCAAPSQPVVAPIGDGSFNDNPVLAALGFAQGDGLPITTVVFDNGG